MSVVRGAGETRFSCTGRVCETYGFDRKYAGKVLAGNRIDKDPKSGKHDSKRGAALLKRTWRAIGCMCTESLKSCIGKSLEYLFEVGHVDPDAMEEGAAMGMSTLDRVLKEIPARTGPVSIRRASAFTCVTGEAVRPVHVRRDTSRSIRPRSAETACTTALLDTYRSREENAAVRNGPGGRKSTENRCGNHPAEKGNTGS